jgi:peptide-methionine (S)-S-oxide reductase
MTDTVKTAVLGGGCFWCTEAVFSRLKGVLKVTPGYAGGNTDKPTYQQVCGGTTGHAEVNKIDFDPSIISYTGLLEVFFHVHDPTTLNRQGNDVGEQYRSIILYSDDEQKVQAESFINELKSGGEFKSTIVTEVKPLTVFYEAEDYHQGYYENNSGQPYCQAIIAPKLGKFRKSYLKLIKPSENHGS